jgi:stalled ribosome rescue protein Dom34
METTTKKLGIWMDHSSAALINLKTESTITLHSDFTFETKEEALTRSEKSMHNKRQQMHEAYYNAIADEILKYNHVLLFGPTDAKTELYNYLKMDLHYKDITIDVAAADKLTDNEKVAFVKNHFKKY